MNYNQYSIEDRLSDDLEAFHNRQLYILSDRIIRTLPTLYKYDNIPETLKPLHFENLLQIHNLRLAIGHNKFKELCVIGVVRNVSYNMYKYPIATSIEFIIPKAARISDKIAFDNVEHGYKQITPDNLDGNFVLLENTYMNRGIDNKYIIQHYANELAFIRTRIKSLTIQSSIVTYFEGVDKENNEQMNEDIKDFYNGKPFIKKEFGSELGKKVNFVEGSQYIPSLITALRDEYNTILIEMLNLLGILNNGIDKASGVTVSESTASQGLMNSVQNIFLSSRQEAFNLLNESLKYNISVKMNDRGYDESKELSLIKEGGEEL